MNTKKKGCKEPIGKWEVISERLQRLVLDVPSLARAVPKVDKTLEDQGWKEAYELNKMGIRDNQAPIIGLECKIRKH